MKWQLIAVDLDGTLLRSDGSISDRTRRALASVRAAGLTLVGVTGRPPRRVAKLGPDIGLSGLVICTNGALVYDLSSQQVVSQTRLSCEAARGLVAALRLAAPGVAFAVEAGLHFGREPHYVLSHNAFLDEIGRCADAWELCAEGVTKLIVKHTGLTVSELLCLTQELAADRAEVTHSGAPFVEVSGAAVTKAHALRLLCEERGISRAHVMAFGDMPNDLPMLGWAGHGVAVANAHPEVVQAAREVTLSNDEDGVAAVLERLASRDFRIDAS